eukprot:TRINITY_DN3097_c0_g1_i10.p2 TRINITY_DN3097_c0_g1~~TRINITY_DN3097_c0_g1_i10.p2  ORF type:complete len:185 (+),score=44.98 TRINITY_DN3097_c0_g1_i10:873-1427(+)
MVYHKVAIVGSTGNLGPSIVNALLHHKFEVTAVTFNNPEDPKYNDLKSKGVKVVHANIDDKATLVHAFHGIDAVVSTVGGALFAKQNALVDAAIEAKVKRFIPSEFGISDQDPSVQHEALLQPKIHTIKHLEEAAKHGKITWKVYGLHSPFNTTRRPRTSTCSWVPLLPHSLKFWRLYRRRREL